ncbi:MAG: LacI family transcriptional regulator [Rhizobacter sp.]|nr:LacI family transcriptional regulator [Rhizobacter sp.]
MNKPQRSAITIKDLANLLGMAHTTVSRALNDHPKISADTKARVREAANKLGYVTNSGARSMRMGSSKLVGLIVPDVQNEFYSSAARAMAELCAQLGYQMVLGVSEDDPAREEQHVRTLRESRCAGVLITPCGASTVLTAELLRQVPTVQFLRFDKQLGSICVQADDIEGTYQATEHLMQLGHRRIGFVGGRREVSTGLRRISGYEAALRKHGLDADPALQRFGPTRPEFGEAALASLLAEPVRPTALVVGSSRQLLGVLRGLRERGMKVPQALSVVGYGDADWFQVSEPPVTAIALPVRDMSERATQLLFELLALGASGRTRTPEPMFGTQLVLRESTARLDDAGAPSMETASVRATSAPA